MRAWGTPSRVHAPWGGTRVDGPPCTPEHTCVPRSAGTRRSRGASTSLCASTRCRTSCAASCTGTTSFSSTSIAASTSARSPPLSPATCGGTSSSTCIRSWSPRSPCLTYATSTSSRASSASSSRRWAASAASTPSAPAHPRPPSCAREPRRLPRARPASDLPAYPFWNGFGRGRCCCAATAPFASMSLGRRCTLSKTGACRWSTRPCASATTICTRAHTLARLACSRSSHALRPPSPPPTRSVRRGRTPADARRNLGARPRRPP